MYLCVELFCDVVLVSSVFFGVFYHLTVVYVLFCRLKRGAYPKNSHVVFCLNKYCSC